MKLNLKIPPVAQAIIAIIFICLLDQYLPLYQINFPFQKTMAAALMTTGLGIALSGVYAFRKSKTTVDPRTPEKASQLVIIGIYKHTRNPMYLGLTFILTSICVLLGTISTIFAIITFILFINKYQIIPEETALKKIFGNNYLQYLQSVRRWL